METGAEKVYVVGHKNPDTDSICSAIAYASLKTKITGIEHTPKRAGQMNEETQYVLEYFHVQPPALITDFRVQVKDVILRQVEGIKGSETIKKAWARMKEENIHTLPVVRDEKLEGLITVGDIATSYMGVHDSTILSQAKTQYRNIAEAIDGEVILGNPHSYLTRGKVGVVASSSKYMSKFIEKDDLVIVSDRPIAQQLAIEMNVGCIVLCAGEKMQKPILEQAKEKEIVVIYSPHDTFTVARLINQSIPVKHFMTKEHWISFKMKDYVDDVREVMSKKRFREYPVLDDDNRFIGFITSRRVLNNRKKKVILVDHNEKNQAVDGIDQAEVLEIIDHHRLSSIETLGPVFFRNQPVGCTATIIYQMYQEQAQMIDSTIAGLLCSAIISDTLMFRSPTCTPLDKSTAEQLAKIADIDINALAQSMFRAGSNLKGKTAEEIIFLDFKQFNVNDIVIGVGQINSMNAEELTEIKEKIKNEMENARQKNRMDMIFFMLTNIIEESSEILCCGAGAKAVVMEAYDLPEDMENLRLDGVVSRKKQLVPTLVSTLHQ